MFELAASALVTAARAAFHGAYCLDGTLPGYWHDAPATPSSDWLLFLDGGADSFNLLVPIDGCTGGQGTDLWAQWAAQPRLH